jgi:maltose O-acetyltransferase
MAGTEWAKMVRGDLYLANDPELVAARARARRLIGDQAQLGPGVQLLTATHPLDAAARTAGPELARPITIGPRAWLGGGVIVVPGVSIGADTVVGAGSVVVHDLPDGVLAVGNPCRVVRPLGPA